MEKYIRFYLQATEIYLMNEPIINNAAAYSFEQLI